MASYYWMMFVLTFGWWLGMLPFTGRKSPWWILFAFAAALVWPLTLIYCIWLVHRNGK